MLETLDKSVGTLVAKLEELKLDSNTLVIFFSDNGQKGPRDGSPLRGAKGDNYEGGIRVPMLAYMPGVIPAGTVCSAMVSGMEYPTTSKAKSTS